MNGLVEQQARPAKDGKKREVRTQIRLPGDDFQISTCAQETAAALMNRPLLFRRGQALIYPSAAGEAKMLPMTPKNFVSWIEKVGLIDYYKFRTVDEETREKVKVLRSLSTSQAEQIIESSQFWPTLPEILRVHPCPLPAVRPNGEIIFLEPGFDAATGIYTFEEVD
jgi:hypothetical protein